MFTRFSKSSIVNQQPKLNSALVGNAGGSLGVFPSSTSSNSAMAAVRIASLGNAFLFGSAGNFAGSGIGCASSNTRGISLGGQLSGAPYTSNNYIAFITFATFGDMSNFGTLSNTKSGGGSGSNQTRGVIAGGSPSRSDIDYITIATVGNATNFGSLGAAWDYLNGGCQSSTRLCWGGGNRASSWVARIDYIDFATTGSSNNFGNLTVSRYLPNGNSSNTRGVWTGGGFATTTMDYITIASTGNATSFGTSVYQHDAASSSVSNNLRIVWAGNSQGEKEGRTLEYTTIATTGNSLAFGDGISNINCAAMSNNHGGLN
jgi:hypothetical protein